MKLYKIIIRIVFIFNSHNLQNLWSWLIDDDITFEKRLFVWHGGIIIHLLPNERVRMMGF